MQITLSLITVAVLLIRLVGEHFQLVPPTFFFWLDCFALVGVVWMAIELVIRRPSKH